MEFKIDLKIFFMILLFSLWNQAEIYCMLIFFAFVHEIGHLLTGVILGYEPARFSINPIGVSVSFKEKLQNYNQKIKKGSKQDQEKIVISLAGPVTNLCILLLCYLIEIPNSSIYYANLLLFIFNLLPIYPLDGGRILKNLLHILLGRKKAWEIVNLVSNSFMIALSAGVSILILYYHNIGIVVMSIYLWGIVIQENRVYAKKMKLYEKIEQYEENTSL